MGKNKRRREELERMMMAQFNKLNQPDPEIERLLGLNQSIVNWHTNPGNTVKDIYKHPTLGAKLPVFQMAMKNRDKGRIGRGIASLGDKYNGVHAQDQLLEDDFERNIQAAGIVETGLTGELDNAQANIASLKGLDYQRRTGANSMIGQLYGAVDQRAQAGGNFWRGLMGGAINSGIAALL
jgi:hypothetical protein